MKLFIIEYRAGGSGIGNRFIQWGLFDSYQEAIQLWTEIYPSREITSLRLAGDQEQPVRLVRTHESNFVGVVVPGENRWFKIHYWNPLYLTFSNMHSVVSTVEEGVKEALRALGEEFPIEKKESK